MLTKQSMNHVGSGQGENLKYDYSTATNVEPLAGLVLSPVAANPLAGEAEEDDTLWIDSADGVVYIGNEAVGGGVSTTTGIINATFTTNPAGTWSQSVNIRLYKIGNLVMFNLGPAAADLINQASTINADVGTVPVAYQSGLDMLFPFQVQINTVNTAQPAVLRITSNGAISIGLGDAAGQAPLPFVNSGENLSWSASSFAWISLV